MFPVASCSLVLVSALSLPPPPSAWAGGGGGGGGSGVACDCLKYFLNFQVELEKLNAATDEINKLETELDESNTTFRMLLGEASRRLQGLARRLGACVDKSRPYYDALDAAASARAACQRAAVHFQRASELHAAAKETVTLAEQRFVSKQDEWQFDSAWQEVLNHAIIKVMDAETRKAESGREHQKKAMAFNSAERKVAQLEDSLKRHILKSRLYFDEKRLCEEQLKTQKEKIENLQKSIAKSKFTYSQSLKALEVISEDIHRSRGEYVPCDDLPVGPREPGVGAEHAPCHQETRADLAFDLERPGATSLDSDEEGSLQQLRLKVRELALKPMEGQELDSDEAWAHELNETINKLDHLLMMKETNQQKRSKFTATNSQDRGDVFAANTPELKSTAEPSQSLSTRWKSDNNLDKAAKSSAKNRSSVEKSDPPTKVLSRSMMSLDVVSLARDTAAMDRESYLKAIIEDKSPSGTYGESGSERNDSPDEILVVECDTSDGSREPVITMTSSAGTNR